MPETENVAGKSKKQKDRVRFTFDFTVKGKEAIDELKIKMGRISTGELVRIAFANLDNCLEEANKNGKKILIPFPHEFV